MNTINSDDVILVTGASGFIAAHIIKLLLDKGYKVRGTVRSTKDEKKITPLKKLSANAATNLELVEADLMKEKGWSEAIRGCKYVLHTASPFPAEIPKNEQEIIKPAVNGTLFVLRASVEKDSIVKRVVLTSSLAAVFGDQFKENHTYTEKDWPNLDDLLPYTKSKYLAEKAAWDFVKEREKNNQPCFELAVINPGLVLGPPIHDSIFTTSELVKTLMTNGMPMIPDVKFPMTDVRDVARAHVQAIIIDEAKNNRHLIACRKDLVHFREVAFILEAEFKPKNYKIPTKQAPNCLMKAFALFYKPLQQLTLNLSRNAYFDIHRLTNVLQVQPINIKDTVIDMAYAMIEKKMIPDLSKK